MTAETEKFIRTLETLAAYAPEKSLADSHAKAKDLMGLTSRTRTRKPKAVKASEAA